MESQSSETKAQTFSQQLSDGKSLLRKVEPPKDNLQQKTVVGGDLTSMLRNAMIIRRNDIEMSDDDEGESDEWVD